MNLALVPKQQKRDYNEDAKALTLPDPSNDDELYWKPFAIFARERKEELHAQIRLALLSSGNDAIADAALQIAPPESRSRFRLGMP